MRRKEKQITERKEIDDIINASPVCRMAMAHGNEPYLVPLSFGYDGNAVYIHTAIQGKKIEIIEANPRVCIEFEHEVEVMKDDDQACKWSFSFQSVIGFGTISELRDPNQKKQGLNHIMRHYTGKAWSFNPKAVEKTRVWKIDIESLHGKRSG
jgi:nitroimidazol reductase NimA-like FMN-containing flavoprotein (pyridoxamine 5'-phosphate oxidase superfamily)